MHQPETLRCWGSVLGPNATTLTLHSSVPNSTLRNVDKEADYTKFSHLQLIPNLKRDGLSKQEVNPRRTAHKQNLLSCWPLGNLEGKWASDVCSPRSLEKGGEGAKSVAAGGKMCSLMAPAGPEGGTFPPDGSQTGSVDTSSLSDQMRMMPRNTGPLVDALL